MKITLREMQIILMGMQMLISLQQTNFLSIDMRDLDEVNALCEKILKNINSGR